MKKYIYFIYIKRRKDKINGNSYFNFIAIDKNDAIINSLHGLYYGSGSIGGLMKTNIIEDLKKQKFNISKKVLLVDLGYGLKKDLNNFNF